MMQSRCVDGKRVALQFGDLDTDDATLATQMGEVGWDIETTGLDWQTEAICTCQLSIGEERIVVVKVNEFRPENLCRLLSNDHVRKVFHHATFDLRFMAYKWGANPSNVACTKIASKLLDPKSGNHTLRGLLLDHLGISIDKTERMSDWLSTELTPSQILYAARDVMYLTTLLRELQEQLEAKNLLSLSRACFAHVPTRVQLDIQRYGDVFEY